MPLVPRSEALRWFHRKGNASSSWEADSRAWALGDCAAVNDAKTGKPCPPTAQFAIREAATVARNIAAQLRGRPLKNLHFDSLGAFCVVGHQSACAELSVPFARSKSVRFAGLLADRLNFRNSLPARRARLWL